MGTCNDYILSSSTGSVEPQQLRATLMALRATELAGSEDLVHQPGDHRPGRGLVENINLNNKEFVVRKYRRGGLIARLVQSSYPWAGLTHSRAFTELKLLDDLRAAGLPVCKPEAAWVIRKGVAYQAYLVTEKIPNAQTLGEVFAANAFTEVMAEEVGGLIRHMHELNAWHADLNAHNILHGDTGWTLIDFDRGCIRKRDNGWREANLQRLNRSFKKLAALHSVDFSESLWLALRSGYEALKLTTLES